ncbi:MAG: hypothetical protein ACI4P4_13120 [Faecousia sp.]
MKHTIHAHLEIIREMIVYALAGIEFQVIASQFSNWRGNLHL